LWKASKAAAVSNNLKEPLKSPNRYQACQEWKKHLISRAWKRLTGNCTTEQKAELKKKATTGSHLANQLLHWFGGGYINSVGIGF